jgi:serine/threonine-protein kinase
LDFAPPNEIDPRSPLPFDVIAECVVQVLKPADRYGYEGRSHSLWFCDAKQPGQYRWYETAFMDSPLLSGKARSIAPFAAHPNSTEAREAIQLGMGVQQVAWPFTWVNPGGMDEFVSRWAGWFALAATGQLAHPSAKPERRIDGSWRKQ